MSVIVWPGDHEDVEFTFTSSTDISSATVQVSLGQWNVEPSTWFTPLSVTFTNAGKTATVLMRVGNGYILPAPAGVYFPWYKVTSGGVSRSDQKLLRVDVRDTTGAALGTQGQFVPAPVAQTPGKVATVDSTGNGVEWDTPSGGGSFPDFTGSGSPEGVVTAAVGKFYADTTNGGLYAKRTGSGNTGWWQTSGKILDSGSIVPGVGSWSDQILALNAPALGQVSLSDVLSWEGTGNGVYYKATGVDGEQHIELQVGSSGQFIVRLNADGTTAFPGPIGVNGATPPAKAATPTTLADVIAILQAVGFCT